MPKLGALIQIGVSPFCRWDSRGALLARSFARFRHFAFVSRTGFSLSWAAFRGCLAPVAGRGNAVCWLLRWLLKSGGPVEGLSRTGLVAAMGVVNHRYNINVNTDG
jgi:hypothetical protein